MNSYRSCFYNSVWHIGLQCKCLLLLVADYLACSNCSNNSSSYFYKHNHICSSSNRDVSTPYSTVSTGTIFLSATQVLSHLLALISTQLPSCIASSFTSLRSHFIATTTRFSNLKYCNSLWTATPASNVLPFQSILYGSKGHVFPAHLPLGSLLCQPKLSTSEPQICYSFHYPVLQQAWFIPCAPQSYDLFFCSKSPYLPIQTLPAFLFKFLFLVLKCFSLCDFLWISSISFIHLP